MRFPLFFSLVVGGMLCLCGTVHAQQQESRIDKIIHPDLNQSFNLSMEKSYNSKAYDSVTGKAVETKAVSWPQKFSVKEFLTGNFRNDKSFWMGDFKFSAGEANTKPRFSSGFAEKTFSTKQVAIKTASGMDKQFGAANVPTRDFRGKEREKLNKELTPEQAANNGFRGDLTEMKSIDDVRALLNKSK